MQFQNLKLQLGFRAKKKGAFVPRRFIRHVRGGFASFAATAASSLAASSEEQKHEHFKVQSVLCCLFSSRALNWRLKICHSHQSRSESVRRRRLNWVTLRRAGRRSNLIDQIRPRRGLAWRLWKVQSAIGGGQRRNERLIRRASTLVTHRHGAVFGSDLKLVQLGAVVSGIWRQHLRLGRMHGDIDSGRRSGGRRRRRRGGTVLGGGSLRCLFVVDEQPVFLERLRRHDGQLRRTRARQEQRRSAAMIRATDGTSNDVVKCPCECMVLRVGA